MDMIIDFKRKVNQEEFENEVHYYIRVIEMTADGAKPLRSLANEDKRDAFFTTGGQVRTTIDIEESGKTTYAIYVSGTGPEVAPDSAKAGYITFDVDVQPGLGGSASKISALDQGYGQAAQGGIPGDQSTKDATSHHQDTELTRR